MPRQAKVPPVRFNLKDGKDGKTETLIYLVFRYDKKRLKYSTGEKVLPSYWNHDRQRATYTKKHPEYVGLNARLNDLENLTVDIFKEHDFGKLELATFKQELNIRTGKETREEDKIPTFEEFVETFLEERSGKVNSKRGTWKIFKTVFNHLKEYGKERGRPLDYKDFTFEFRHKFENWLYLPPREHSTNYAAKVFEITRQFLREAARRGYNDNKTFEQRGWTIPKAKVQNIVLSFQELETLYQLDLNKNPRLDRVRDLFLLGAYSGLRYSDFTRIKPQHIIREGGVEMIQIRTIKTDTEVVIPLMPELKNILVSNQKMNDYLKELCELAEINEKISLKKSKAGKQIDINIEKWEAVSTHTARRSFATNFYEMGIPAINLMQITGHSTEKQFMGYINIDKKQNAINIAQNLARIMKEGIKATS